MKRTIIILIIVVMVLYIILMMYHNPIYGKYKLAVVSDKGLNVGSIELDVSYSFVPRYYWLDQRFAFEKNMTCNIDMKSPEFREYNGIHNVSGPCAGYFNNAYFFSGEGDIAFTYENNDDWKMAFGEFFGDRFILK